VCPAFSVEDRVVEKVKIKEPFRYAVRGIHVISVSEGTWEVGQEGGQLHPDAAAHALAEKLGEEVKAQKSGPKKASEGAE